MESRDGLKKVATRVTELWSSYTKQRNRVTKLIRKSIQDQYKAIVENSKRDPRKMWKTINRILNKDTQATVLSNINKDGEVLTKDLDMLEALNHHFVSVGTNLTKKITPKPDDDCLKYVVPVDSKMTLNTIDSKYVFDAIGRLKNGKVSGPDKIYHKSGTRCCKIYCPPQQVHFQFLNNEWGFS